MDFTQFLLGEKYLTALGWTLIHSIWQITLFGGLLWAFLRLTPNNTSSQLRYAAALSTLLLIFLASCWTFTVQLDQVGHHPERILVLSLEAGADLPEAALALPNITSAGKETLLDKDWAEKINKYLPYLVNLWILGVIFYLVRLTGSIYDLQKLHKKHHESVSQILLKKADSLCAAMGIYGKVQVLKSNLVQTPVTYGFLKPVILLPASLLLSIAPSHLEAVLAHELAHIKRNDYLANLFQSFLEVFFFFHPCFWWISKLIDDERENATDDLALAAGIHPKDLAYGLAAIANYYDNPAPDMALAAAGSQHTTFLRIKRILGKRSAKPQLSPIIPITMILTLIIASALMVGAQDRDVTLTAPLLLTEVSSFTPPVPQMLPEVVQVQKDTVPAKKTTETSPKEAMPILELPPAPQLDAIPNMPEPPPIPALPHGYLEIPTFDLSDQAETLANLTRELQELAGNDSPEAKKRQETLEAALGKVHEKIEAMSEAFNGKMSLWQEKHGESFKKYEEDMKVWTEKMEKQHDSWESAFAPKMKEFEEKMKQWQLENEPKLKEFEEKMKQWVEENEAGI